MVEGLSFLATLILVALLAYWVVSTRKSTPWTAIFDLGEKAGARAADADDKLPPWRRR